MTTFHVKINNDAFAAWLYKMLSALDFVEVHQEAITDTIDDISSLSDTPFADVWDNQEDANWHEFLLNMKEDV